MDGARAVRHRLRMRDSQQALFPDSGLPAGLVENLRRMNPWWEHQPMRPQPVTRRHLVAQIRRRMDSGIAPIVVVRGPRQIGKTTAQMQLIGDLLAQGVSPGRVFHVQFDEIPTLLGLQEPLLRLADWFEARVLKETFNAAATRGEPAYLFLDELQNVREWAAQLKSLVDNSEVRVVVTGSSALRIEQGRDSLAGRISTLETGVLSLTEISALRGFGELSPFLADNGLEAMTRREFWIRLVEYGRLHSAIRDRAFEAFSERGGYPLVHLRAELDWSLVADQLNETVIKRVIQHDLRVGERGRKRDASLLEELFRLACRYAGQSPSADLFSREVQRALGANVGRQRVAAYLRFLGDTLLLRVVPPLEIRLKRQKGNAKVCLVDHGLRASWLQEIIPLAPRRLREMPELTTLAGHLAESVVGATLSTIHHLDLSHFPARGAEPEVDFILTLGAIRIPLEVKYQARIDPFRDTEGLRAFVEKAANNAPFGILITQTDQEPLPDPRIIAMPLSSLMLLR